MSVTILDASVRAAFAAAATQIAQLESVRVAFPGNVTLRIEGAGGQHLRTLTLAPFTINTSTPRGLVCGAVLADTAVAPNAPGAAAITPTAWEFRNGSTPIFRVSALTQGAIKTLCRPTFAEVVFSANPGLPIDVLPAWRVAMTATDRLYNVSSGVPGVTPGLVPNPLPNHFGVWSESPSFGAGEDVMSGYSSGTYLQGVGGTYGTMIYGTGGHTRLQNQILGLNLNQDSPTFTWWRQPEFQTSDTAGADLYYSPSEAAAIAAGPRGSVAVVNMSGGELSFAGAWDGAFPVATSTGWIYPRRMNTGTMGNNAPHGYRYTSICEVPASVTGSDPCLLVGGPRPQGPFALSEYPSGVNQAQWFEPSARYASGRRRWPIHLLNLRTNEWSIIGYWPDQATAGFQGPSWRADPARRRVWASVDGLSPGIMHIDFSAGIGGAVVSNITFASAGGSNARQVNSSGALTVGHPTKLLWIWPNANNQGGLFIQDCLANTTAAVDLTSQGLAVGTHEKIGTTWDVANNRVLIVQPINVSDPSAGIEYFSIPLPADHTNAGAYTVTRRTLAVDPSVTTLTAAAGIGDFYGKTQLLPELGVILVPFSKGRMLGFRPSV